MASVQLQRVRRCAGEDCVIDYCNVEISSPREYRERIQALARECADDEFTRTVADDSPLCVRPLVPLVAAMAELDPFPPEWWP